MENQNQEIIQKPKAKKHKLRSALIFSGLALCFIGLIAIIPIVTKAKKHETQKPLLEGYVGANKEQETKVELVQNSESKKWELQSQKYDFVNAFASGTMIREFSVKNNNVFKFKINEQLIGTLVKENYEKYLKEIYKDDKHFSNESFTYENVKSNDELEFNVSNIFKEWYANDEEKKDSKLTFKTLLDYIDHFDFTATYGYIKDSTTKFKLTSAITIKALFVALKNYEHQNPQLADLEVEKMSFKIKIILDEVNQMQHLLFEPILILKGE
ncbi:hypothetical protein ACWXVL_00845 [Mycoplasma sp. 128]|uniref:hypothetical protein n=1 Tax=Mycoplasma sp. 3341 TaxID=3447506 RepID=UPI003F65D749